MFTTNWVWSQALPFQQFHVLFNSLFKVLFIFRSLYLCAIGLSPIFSFRWNLPPILSCIPKQLDSSKTLHMEWSNRSDTGFSPSVTSCSKELGPVFTPKKSLQITTRTPKTPDSKFELLPLHSQLLRQSLLVSFPPLIDMLKFSGYPYLIRGQKLRIWGLRQKHPHIHYEVYYTTLWLRGSSPLDFAGDAIGIRCKTNQW